MYTLSLYINCVIIKYVRVHYLQTNLAMRLRRGSSAESKRHSWNNLTSDFSCHNGFPFVRIKSQSAEHRSHVNVQADRAADYLSRVDDIRT